MSARRVEVRYETMHGDVRAKSERVAVWYRPTQPRPLLARKARHAIEMRARRARQDAAEPNVVIYAMPHKRVERLAIMRPDQEQRRAERELMKKLRASIPLPVSKHETAPGKCKGRGAYKDFKNGFKLYRVGGLRP